MSIAQLSRIMLLVIIVSFNTFAQDERFYRKIFTGEHSYQKKEKVNYKLVVDSEVYKIDLNRDGIDEKVFTSNRDGIDYFVIKDYPGNILLEVPLDTIGNNSRVFKLGLKTISKNSDVLILHYYEGHIDSSTFEATARLYFVTIDNRNLKTLSLFKGPHFWHEKETNTNIYINRNYMVNVYDYNGDGRNEISVNFNKIARIYFYLEEGRWKRI